MSLPALLPYAFGPTDFVGLNKPPPAEALAEGLDAVVINSVVIDAAVGDADAGGLAGTASTAVALDATVADADADGLLFVEFGSDKVNLSGSVATATASGYDSSISTGLTLTADIAEATADTYPAAIETQEAVDLLSTLGAADATGFTADVTTSVELFTDNVAEATADAYVSDMRATVQLNAVVGEATASGLTGDIDIIPGFRNLTLFIDAPRLGDYVISLPYVTLSSIRLVDTISPSVGLPYVPTRIDGPRR